jgi:hypothetical protein
MACLPLSACDDPQPAHTLPDVQPGGMNYAVIICSSEFRNTSILKLADQFGTKHQSATPETIACVNPRSGRPSHIECPNMKLVNPCYEILLTCVDYCL